MLSGPVIREYRSSDTINFLVFSHAYIYVFLSWLGQVQIPFEGFYQ